MLPMPALTVLYFSNKVMTMAALPPAMSRPGKRLEFRGLQEARVLAFPVHK